MEQPSETVLTSHLPVSTTGQIWTRQVALPGRQVNPSHPWSRYQPHSGQWTLVRDWNIENRQSYTVSKFHV